MKQRVPAGVSRAARKASAEIHAVTIYGLQVCISAGKAPEQIPQFYKKRIGAKSSCVIAGEYQ